VYQGVLDDACAQGIPFALGGAFAVATYTGHWRNTKDIDLYVLPEYRDAMIEVLKRQGLSDLYDSKPYDRWWIYRATRNGAIVDVIWAMANHRQQIDQLWMSGPDVELRGRRMKVLPAEAMLWDKLYIIQKERCDWPDIMNLLYSVGAQIDWEYLLNRMGEDGPLMTAALSVFRWLSPARAEELPPWLWERLGLIPGAAEAAADIVKPHVELLDRRPWYGPDRETLQPAA
jgi:hypothetical protein